MTVASLISIYKGLSEDQKSIMYKYLYESQSKGGSELPADAPEALKAWAKEYDALEPDEQQDVVDGIGTDGGRRRRKTKKAGRRKTKKAGRRKTKKAGSWKY